MTIEEYLTLIKENFPYLFTEFAFDVVHQEEYRPSYGWFRIGLESPICRILFAREQGAGVMLLGPFAAPFDNENDPQWVDVMGLLAFILKMEWDWSFLDNVPFKEKHKDSMAFVSRQLKPVCEEVLKMFRSPETITEWRHEYDQFIHEIARRRYGIG